MPAMITILIMSAGMASTPPSDFPCTAWTESGLSGYWHVESADFVPRGELRLGVGLGSDMPGGDFGAVPLSLAATWGAGEGLEAGARLPVYLHDSAYEGGLPGDLSLGVKYLYETTRGGTALALKSSLSLPTGDAPRDRGAELRAGFCTSTVYRLVRLTMDFDYYAEGGQDPLDARIRDGLDIGVGCASFVLPDVQIFLAAGARTAHDPLLAFGAVAAPLDWLHASASAEVEMADDPGFGFEVSASVLPGLI